jgi:hypothetical protein
MGSIFTAEAVLSGVDASYTLSWHVREEVDRSQESDGGDFEPTPPSIVSECHTHNTRFQFQLEKPGEYRLYCQVDNDGDASGVANIPFLVTKHKAKTTAKNNKVKHL